MHSPKGKATTALALEMKPLLIIAPVILAGCAPNLTAASLQQEPNPVSKASVLSPPPAIPIPKPLAFVCRAYVRSSVFYEAKRSSPVEIRMSEPGDRSVSSGAFRFRVLYDNDRYEGRSLITYVYSQSTGKLIEETLFQLDRLNDPVNQFGGEGFTGLHYVYAPDSTAELQYICSLGDAPAGS